MLFKNACRHGSKPCRERSVRFSDSGQFKVAAYSRLLHEAYTFQKLEKLEIFYKNLANKGKYGPWRGGEQVERRWKMPSESGEKVDGAADERLWPRIRRSPLWLPIRSTHRERKAGWVEPREYCPRLVGRWRPSGSPALTPDRLPCWPAHESLPPLRHCNLVIFITFRGF